MSHVKKQERVYKSPIGGIPKIVNNFESKTLNQKIFYDIIGEEHTQLILCHGIGLGKTYVSIYREGLEMSLEEVRVMIN